MKRSAKNKTRSLLIEFVLYFLRWQASTPILAVCLIVFANLGNFWATVVANGVGAIIFFGIDRLIFTKGEGDEDD